MLWESFAKNFPKAFTKQSETLSLALFPTDHPEPHELQPGEQKTHTLWFSVNPQYSAHQLANTSSVIIAPAYLANTQTLPFFNAEQTQDDIDTLINLGLTHDNNFFQKRERIDEYGWRNFGDIYADHETLEYQGNDALISHYNNQYDPLYGFLRQYLTSGDTQWLTLANDLANHIIDIDIYHTNVDKPEYNHGLFWHTDHYLPAETATHRTYSKYQQANAYQDHAGGGGPGGQHCYTTGLMLHYFLTGQESAKQAVIKLADWIGHVYNGSGTFFDTLLGIKNSQIPGYKNVVTNQYPLDRGTGNYIIALIDAYEVSGKQSYLDQASLVIKHTAAPNEDLTQRHLTHVEETWFYTVFLQAVYRYLVTKETIEQLDESYFYAQATLLHFAHWMAQNEQPYLNKPEILEYPNHTWAAQDIRKANVLYMASRYFDDSNKKTAILNKADEIYHYVEHSLLNENTHYFTRILCILMQNHGVKHYALTSNKPHTLIKPTPLSSPALSAMPTMNKRNATKVLFKSLSNTSLKQELNWLRKRVKKVDNLMKKLEG